MIDVEKYKSAIIAASGRSAMRADYPPSWDADGIRDDYIEKRSEELEKEMLNKPEEMAEMLWSGFGGENGAILMYDLCNKLSALKQSVISIAPVGMRLKISLDDIMTEYIQQKAEGEIDG